HHGSRAEAAHPALDRLGIAVYVAKVLRLQPEPLVRDLPEHRLVALPLVLASHEKRRRAVGVELDLRELATRRRACALDRVRNADAAQLSLAPGFLAPARELFPLAEHERLVHHLLE